MIATIILALIVALWLAERVAIAPDLAHAEKLRKETWQLS